MRSRAARAVAVGTAVLLLATGQAAAGSDADPHVSVTTFAGDPAGSGPALELSVMPFDLVEHDGGLLIAAGSVVRRLDLATRTLSTFAGTGVDDHRTDVGDGGPATGAVLSGVRHLDVASDGSVYLTESTGDRVRRVLPDGTITTVAGRTRQSSGGDGGPATDASFYGARGVAVAGDGTVYVADHHNHRVRAISPGGTITTVAGTGEPGSADEGARATAAPLRAPTGLTLDTDGSLLVADSGNHRVRRLRDGVLTTVAGSGDPGDLGPEGQFGDGTGELGDGGPAVAASLHEPGSITVDGDGYLVADTLHHKVRRIDRDGVISTVAGVGEREFGRDGGQATSTHLFAPERALRLADGSVVIADTRAARVRLVEPDGRIIPVAGNYYGSFSGDGGPATRAQLAGPSTVAVAPSGDVYVGDVDLVRRVRAHDGVISTVMGLLYERREPPADGTSALSAYLTHASALAVDAQGTTLYVAEQHVVRAVDLADGTQRVHAGIWGVGLDGGDGLHRRDTTFVRPAALAAAPDGSLYVADVGAHRVRRIAPDGTVHAVAGTGAPGSDGDGGPASAARLDGPSSLALDETGTLHVVDAGNGRLRAVSPDGRIRTVAGAGAGAVPRGLPSPALEATIQPDRVAALPGGDLALISNWTDLLHYDAETQVVTRLVRDAAAFDGPPALARFATPSALAWDTERERLLVAELGGARLRVVLGARDAEASPGGREPVEGACPAGAFPSDRFADVPASNVHRPAVDCLVWWGVTRGRTSTTYAPGESITRGQMATFLAAMITTTGRELPSAGRDWFHDDDGSPHEDSTNRLAEAGIVVGRGDGAYQPGSAVRRDQMASFLVQAYGFLGQHPDPAESGRFTDDDDSPHEHNIDTAAARGFTTGLSATSFGPALPVGRDQMASFVTRVLDDLVRGGRLTVPDA